jgi:HEAT repeat protein
MKDETPPAIAGTLAPSVAISAADRRRIEALDRLTAGGEAAVPSLLDMLDEPSWTVRRAVVAGLAALGDEAVAPLVARLATRRENEAAIAANVDALVGSSGNVEAAISLLADNESAAVVADVAQVLGRRRSVAALPVLRRLVAHADDNVAVAAIEGLGRIGGRGAIETLIGAARSGNFFRTFPAIDVLGRSGDPRAVDPLTALLDDPHYTLEAARALGRSGDRRAVAPLLALLGRPADAEVRVAALALAGLHARYLQRYGEARAIAETARHGAAPAAERRLVRILPGSDAAEQEAICTVLGWIGSEASISTLAALLAMTGPVAAAAADAMTKLSRENDTQLLAAIRAGGSARRMRLLPLVTRVAAADDVAGCLDDPDPEVRVAACEALARIGAVGQVGPLFDCLTDGNPAVVQAAVAAIQALGGTRSEELALGAVRDEAPVVRRAGLRILTYFAFPSAFDACVAGLADVNPQVREAAIAGLPYLDDPRAHDLLVETTRDAAPRTRAAAMRALAQVPGPDVRATAALLRGLADGDPWVRYYACQTLGRIGYEAAGEAIGARLTDDAGQVRVAAVEALSHLSGDAAFEALRRAAEVDEPDVRRASLVGLGISKRPEALPVVLAATDSTDAATRLVALSALVAFEDPRVLPALARAAADEDESVRGAAASFLAGRRGADATNAIITLLRKLPGDERLTAALANVVEGRVATVVGALETADDEIAPVLTGALARMQRADATAALHAALESTNVCARKAAAPTLAAIGTPEAIASLQRALTGDPDPEVRHIAALLLSQ